MGDLAYLRKDVEPIIEQGLSRPVTGFAIHEWMFDAKPYLVSRDDPASLRYVCQECGLVEPKPVSNGWIRRRCACELAMYEEASHAGFKAETQAQVDTQKTSRTYTWLGEAEDELLQKTFDNFTRGYQPKAYDECLNYVKLFIEARRAGDTFSRNIMMFGSYGTGKTHLAAAILNDLRTQMIPCLFCTGQGFFHAFYSKSFEGKLSLIEAGASTPLLVVDELDKLYVRIGDDMSYQKATLAEMLDRRYRQRLPTIVTTNEQEDLGRWLSGATISRLQERVTLLPMNGIDYRGRSREDM